MEGSSGCCFVGELRDEGLSAECVRRPEMRVGLDRWRAGSDKRLVRVDSIPRTDLSRFIDGPDGDRGEERSHQALIPGLCGGQLGSEK